jgi:hypothetical protein
MEQRGEAIEFVDMPLKVHPRGIYQCAADLPSAYE